MLLAPLTLQERVVDCPAVTLDGVAVNEVIVGPDEFGRMLCST
jgi:hypothetical protein